MSTLGSRPAAAPSEPSDDWLKPALGIVAATFVTCWIATAIGSPLVMFLVVWGPALVYLFVKQPAHVVARVLLLLGLMLEGPDERAGNGYWTSPFDPASTVFFGGLNKWLGIPGGSFPLFVILLFLLIRKGRTAALSRSGGVPPESRQVPRTYLLGIFGLVIWGLVRGGEGQPIFWQLLHPVTMGIGMYAFLYSLRGARDLKAVGTIVIVVAITKGILVAWVYFVVCGPKGIVPFYATTHSDSANFATAFVVLLTRAWEERSKAAKRLLLIITPLLLVSVHMNNRRLAYVDMILSVVVAYAFMKPSKLKKRISTIAIVAAPLLFAYVKVGENSTNPFFAPAKALSSVTNSSDDSSISRDIENMNLVITVKNNVLFGTGFGHGYEEVIKGPDITRGHSMYLYIPHNSVLWYAQVGGMVGLYYLWLPYAALAFFAARVYRTAKAPIERAGALTSICVSLIALFHGWGDMGFNSYTSCLLLEAAYALSARMDGAVQAKKPSAAAIAT